MNLQLFQAGIPEGEIIACGAFFVYWALSGIGTLSNRPEDNPFPKEPWLPNCAGERPDHFPFVIRHFPLPIIAEAGPLRR